MQTFFGIAFETLLIVALVLANGFFVAAEFALVKVRVSQLRPLQKTGGWRVKFAIRATKHLDAALSATQLGITLASLGLGWLGEPFVAHRLVPLLAYFGVTDEVTVESISFSVAFAGITFLHIIFGELAPKSLAIQRAKGVSLMVAAPLMVFYTIFFPFIWALNSTANLFLRWAGLRTASDAGEHGFSQDELEYVFSHARHTHPSDAVINKLLVQSLRVRGTYAQQIMLPREQIVALWTDKSPQENLREAQRSGHSRFPVCTGSLDQVRGIVVVREWLWQMIALGPDTSFEPLIRPTLTFQLKTALPEMMERFRTTRTHLAVVLDADGRLAGLVTLEDVLEEIVGDIRDELDIARGPIYEKTDDSILVSAGFTMRELQAETGWTFQWQPRETLGSWVTRHLGRLPKRGETFRLFDYEITIVEATTERLRRIRVERKEAEVAD